MTSAGSRGIPHPIRIRAGVGSAGQCLAWAWAPRHTAGGVVARGNGTLAAVSGSAAAARSRAPGRAPRGLPQVAAPRRPDGELGPYLAAGRLTTASWWLPG